MTDIYDFLMTLRGLDISESNATFQQLCYQRVISYCQIRSCGFEDLTISQLFQIIDCCALEFNRAA